MILDDYINILINSRNIKYYEELGYNFLKNVYIDIQVTDLPRNSHRKINCKCDICDNIKILQYREYMNSFEKYEIYCCSPKCAQYKNILTNNIKYKHDNVFQNHTIKNKIKETNLKKYGCESHNSNELVQNKKKQTLLKNYNVTNPMFSDVIREKIKNTFLYNYKVDNPMKCEFIKNKNRKTQIDNGNWLPDYMLSEFVKYRKNVDNLSRSIYEKFLINWDGYDYYDNEYIKDNFNLKSGDRNYPTFDHKLSVKYGFINNISVDVISNIDNLCITKRFINCQKGAKNHDDFIKIL